MRLLFVCVQNAGRSQMAWGIAANAGLEARSAGSRPAAEVHPEVVEAMGEVGVDLSGRQPRGLTAADLDWADTVVTMGCGDECPAAPGKRRLDWELDDPHGRPIEEVRAIRDEIGRRVRGLAAAAQ